MLDNSLETNKNKNFKYTCLTFEIKCTLFVLEQSKENIANAKAK